MVLFLTGLLAPHANILPKVLPTRGSDRCDLHQPPSLAQRQKIYRYLFLKVDCISNIEYSFIIKKSKQFRNT